MGYEYFLGYVRLGFSLVYQKEDVGGSVHGSKAKRYVNIAGHRVYSASIQ